MSDTLNSLISRLASDPYGIWVALVELILIGLCVNWCASVLHGTRGTRPLRGILIILVAATVVVRVLAGRFDWVRLDLLYSYVLAGLSFIALVVFQPELRRAVIRVGDVRFRKKQESQTQLVAALVKSAGFLSRNRYGALIAIQRHVNLTGWAENGTLINAEVSANLLNTIFFPNSPLHDLGVIIRGNRVVAANCQFPSAESDEIDATLGSRHLAAVGMSYETDALLLVISEETGVVSLADNGKLTRYLSLDDLSDELASRLAGLPAKTRGKSKKKGLPSRVWAVVRRALVVVPLTMLIWYLADQATLAETQVQLQLSIRHADAQRIVEFDAPGPKLFNATFQGSVRAIDRLEAASQPIKVTWVLPEDQDADLYRVGKQEIRGVVRGLRDEVLRGLEVTDVELRELEFRVVQTVTLLARVQPEVERARIVVERVVPPEVEVVVRTTDLPADPSEIEALIPAALDRLLMELSPGESELLERVRLQRRLRFEEHGKTIDVLRVEPSEVNVQLRVVGEPKRVDNVVVQLLVSPDVLERYRVAKDDLNEWRISFEVEGAESVIAPLGSHSFDAYALVTPGLVPAEGNAPDTPIRVDVTIIPKERGVTILSKPTVRVRLLDRNRHEAP